jgi:hypothetical protein
MDKAIPAKAVKSIKLIKNLKTILNHGKISKTQQS